MRKFSRYNLEIIKDDEALLLLETSMENGSNPKEAVKDLRMIDNLLFARRLHMLSSKSVSITKAGYLRKNNDLWSYYSQIIDAEL